LPISDKYNSYAKKVLQLLRNSDIRGLVDERDEKIGKKIRDAEIKKIPFMLIIGEKEEQENAVSVREHGKGDQGSLGIQQFIDRVNDEVKAMLSV
jgi:threonyl-tRNA synthetase